MKKHITTLLLAVLGLTLVSFMTNDSIVLRFKPQVGKTMTYSTKSTQIMTMNVQGQSMNTTQTLESKMQMTAKEVTADSIFCEMVTKSMKLTQSTMGMTLTFDSEHPENTSPMLAGATKAYQDLIDKKMQIVVDPLGKTIKSDSDNLQSLNTTFPEKAISEGSQWTNNHTQTISDVEVNVTTTYTVAKITKKETTLNLESTLKSSVVNGTDSGSMVIDNATGIAKSSTVKTNLNMTIEQQGISIPMTISGTTTTTIE